MADQQSGRRRTSAAVVLGVLSFLALYSASHAASAGAQGQTATVTFKAGYNLIGVTPKSDLSAVSGPLLHYNPDTAAYDEVDPANIRLGDGYWANFPVDTIVTLQPSVTETLGTLLPQAPGSGSTTAIPSVTLTPGAGKWTMIGAMANASPTMLNGADVIYVYDPVNGFAQATSLQPGQGAWAISTTGQPIVLSTRVAGAASPGSSPSSPTSPASQSGGIAKGEVLFADDYSSPGTGRLSTDLSTAGTRTYEGGEYVLRTTDPLGTTNPATTLPGVFSDTVLSVDIRLAGDTNRRYIRMYCRYSAAGAYSLIIDASGGYILGRLDGGNDVELEARQSSAIHAGSEKNHVELACVGPTIQVTVNAITVATVTDQKYASGAGRISIGHFAGTQGTVEGRFSSLVVYRGIGNGAATTGGAAGSGAAPAVGSVTSTAPGTFSSPLGFQLQGPPDWQQGSVSPDVHFDLELRSLDNRQYIFVQVLSIGGTFTSDPLRDCSTVAAQVARGASTASPPGTPQSVAVPNADAAASCTLDWIDDAGVAYHDIYVVAIRGRTMYLLTLDFSAAFFGQNSDLVNRIISSFRLT